MSSPRAPLIALAVLVLGTACPRDGVPQAGPTASTGATPTPTPALQGLQVGVVLAPPSDVAALENAAVASAAVALPDVAALEVSDVRVLEPETESFRGDQIALLADDGADLVCTVGQAGAEALADVADDYPRTRFCLLAGTLARPPGNVLTFPWRIEEGGYVLGAAAAWSGGAARVGFISGVRGQDIERIRRGYDAGVRGARPSVEVAVGFAIPGEDRVVGADDAAQAAELQYDGRSPVRVALVLGDAETLAGVLPVASAAGGAIAAWGADPVEVVEADDDVVLLTVVRRFDVALAEAVRRTLEQRTLGEVALGWSDRAFEVVPGGSALYAGIAERIGQLTDELATGQVEVPGG